VEAGILKIQRLIDDPFARRADRDLVMERACTT
jgi:hypothetical protein